MSSNVGTVKFSISFQGSCVHGLETIKAIDMLFNKETECAEISNHEEYLTFKTRQLKTLTLPLDTFNALQLSIKIFRQKELSISVTKDNKVTHKWQDDDYHFKPVKIISKPEVNEDDELHITVSKQDDQFVATIECTNDSLLRSVKKTASKIFKEIDRFGR